VSAPRTLSDRYVLDTPIGTGAMGTVFRATDTSNGRTVAIKLLKSMDAADIQRFDREFQIVSQLRHEAIVSCWGAARTESGEAYFVMDWLEGESLRDRLRREELSLEQTLAIGTCVLRGLSEAHARDVVHRDVKPANIFLEGNDPSRAKLLDFGIARHVFAGETLTGTGQFIGTPGYVAPEQIRNQRVDQRADVYSLGCLLFRCLTGRAVFDEEQVLEMLVRVTRDRAPRLAELRPDLSVGLCELVDRMLERDPVDRPADAASVLCELEALEPALAQTMARLPAPSSKLREAEGPASNDASSRASGPTSLNAAHEVAPTPRPRRTPLMVAGGLLVGLAVVGAGVRLLGNREGEGAVATFGSLDDRIGKDARQMWGAIRMGSRNGALRRLSQRQAAGTITASEQLWWALVLGPGEPAQRSFRQANEGANQLTSFETAVANAAAPLFATPPDYPAGDKALSELAAEAQAPELWLVLGRVRVQMNDRKRAEAALANVPAAGWSTAMDVERVYFGHEFFDFDASRKAAEACLESRPDAVDCLAALSRRTGMAGQCDQMEAHVRKWIATDPDDPKAYDLLANVLAIKKEPDGALIEALEQKWARLPEKERAGAKQADLLLIEGLRGRFDVAADRARAAIDALPADAPMLQRLAAMFGSILVATEIGDDKTIKEVSLRVLERAAAATPASATDAAYFLLFASVARRYVAKEERWDALVTAAFERYEKYLAAQGGNLRPYQRFMPWVVGYAAGATSADNAKLAYKMLPRYEPLPGPGREDDIDIVIGAVLRQNGEPARALPYLQRASRSCLILENPYAVARGTKELGQALEDVGDIPAARAAYERVLEIWPHSKPRSLAVVYAEKRLARLRR
jgi:tetratricopeptide (TPR) repeat protein